MPTSGEAQIRPTSTYNLRSRPLPKTKVATGHLTPTFSSARKQEQIQQVSKLKKSQIPVPVNAKSSSAIDHLGTKTSASKPKIGVRKVPDFAKLHKSWQQTFNKGKACSKKQCTKVREFDLTKPGTVFQTSYFDGKKPGNPKAINQEDDVFQTDEEALCSILNSGIPTPSKENGRATMAGYGWSKIPQQKPNRQTLGALPTTFQSRTNNAENTNSQNNPQMDLKLTRQKGEEDESENKRPGKISTRKMSLADQQKAMDINFEPDAGALASILNNTGANFSRPAPMARQTIGAATGAGQRQGSMFGSTYRQSQGPVRTSIYYQRPRKINFDRVFTDYANHILSRLSMAETSQPLNNPTLNRAGQARQVNRAISQSVPRTTRTPSTARRIMNPHYQDMASSPVLRPPPSALKKPNTHKEGKPQSVKWADVLSPTGERRACVSGKDELVTTLFADEDTAFTEPYSMNQAVTDDAQLQAACVVAKRDEIKQLEQQAALHRNKLEEMDEIERQLELEIQRLQQENLLPSPPVGSSESQRSFDQSSNPQIVQGSINVQPVLYGTLEVSSESKRQPQTPQKPIAEQAPPKISTITSNEESTSVGMLTSQMLLGEEMQIPTSPMGFKHSPRSPFQSSKYQTKSDVEESHFSQMNVDSFCRLGSGRIEYDTSEVARPEIPKKLQQSFDFPEKPFAEVQKDVGASRAKNELEIQSEKIGVHSSANELHQIEGLGAKGGSVIRQNSKMLDSGFSSRETQLFSRMPSELLDQKSINSNQPRKFVFDHPTRQMSGSLQYSFQETCSQPENPYTHELPSYHTGKKERERPVSGSDQPPLYPKTEHRPVFNEPQCRLQYSTGCHDLNVPAQIPAPSGLSTSNHIPSFVAQEQSKDCQDDTAFPATGHFLKHRCTPSKPPVFSRDRIIYPTHNLGHQLMSSNKELSLDIPQERPTAWMSSTPARLKTPRAVKPHSLIKELALKKSLLSTNLSGKHPAPCPQYPLPIHTPLAMRTMSIRNSNHHDGSASSLQYVSPIGLRASPVCLGVQSDTYGTSLNPPSPQQSVQNVDPTPDTSFAIQHETKTSNPVHPQHSVHSSNSCHTSVQTDCTYNGYHRLHSSEQYVSTKTNSKDQGSLSLGAELMGSAGAAAFLKSKLTPLLSHSTNQMFQEALLDEECALYACRLPSKFSPRTAQDYTCFDPVAKILMDGDDMHFVPIQSKGRVFISSPVGSAFRSYENLVG